MVWESLRLRMEKNSADGGNPAARKRDFKRRWITGKSGDVVSISWDTRHETANGRARRDGVEVKYW